MENVSTSNSMINWNLFPTPVGNNNAIEVEFKPCSKKDPDEIESLITRVVDFVVERKIAGLNMSTPNYGSIHLGFYDATTRFVRFAEVEFDLKQQKTIKASIEQQRFPLRIF